MTYTTPAKLLQQFNSVEMAQLSDPDLDSVVDDVLLQLAVDAGDRSAYTAEEIAAADQASLNLQAAIDSAVLECNGYLFPRYDSPLTQTQIDSSALGQFCADIARYRLADDLATEEIEKRYSRAVQWLRDVQSGRASLGGDDGGVAADTGRMVVRQGVSHVDWGTY